MKPKPWPVLTPTGLDTTALSAPLRARHPWHYQITGDLFASLPFESIAAVLGVIAACPRHEFEVVTLCPERAGEFFAHDFGLEGAQETIARAASHHGGIVWDSRGSQRHLYPMYVGDIDKRRAWAWPLPNLRLTTHVTTQAEADARIPALLACPAAAYGLTMTPGEGMDIARFMRMGSCCECGMERGMSSGCQPRKDLKGREVGWIRCNLGTRKLRIVTVRGAADPIHPDHIRTIRDQCKAAGVPFRFEGWGAWCPLGQMPVDEPWPTKWASRPWGDDEPGMYRIGARRSGRLLDGVTYDGGVT